MISLTKSVFLASALGIYDGFPSRIDFCSRMLLLLPLFCRPARDFCVFTRILCRAGRKLRIVFFISIVNCRSILSPASFYVAFTNDNVTSKSKSLVDATLSEGFGGDVSDEIGISGEPKSKSTTDVTVSEGFGMHVSDEIGIFGERI